MLDRLHCSDEELNTLQRSEMNAFLESLNPWTDPTKTDEYWKLSDLHREEWTKRVALRKKSDKAEEKTEAEEEDAA